MKKTLLLFFILLLGVVSCKKEDDTQGGGEETIPANYTISGTVAGNDGKKLQGVVVSDGRNCAVTNSSGTYYLVSDLSSTEYVFVSTPKEYAAPVQDGQATFWKFLKDVKKGSDGKYSIDFTLNKIASPDRFTIFIFADPQPRKNTAGLDKLAYHSLDCCQDMYRDMKEYAATLSGYPVYGIGLGDIVHQDLSLLPIYRQGMATTGVTTYNIIGNHDHGHNLKPDAQASKDYEAIMGPANYSFNLGGMHFLMLDNMISISAVVDGKQKYSDDCSTGLTDDIWEWVKNDLSHVAPGTTLMVCAHSPMMRSESGSDRTGAHLGDLRNILGRYPKAYVWAGHTHTTFNYVDTSNPTIETHTVTRATGALWSNEYLGSNGTPRGYVVFNYDNGDVSWKFKPTYYQSSTYVGEGNGGKTPDYTWRDWDYENGKAVLKSSGQPLDDTYQMQLFPPGTYANNDNYIYANIFLWDELWERPRFTVDGVFERMIRVTEKDFRYSYSDWTMSSFYNKNTKINPKEAFVPNKNNNSSMFRVYVSKAHGTGTVSVVDRFGNQHESTITW